MHTGSNRPQHSRPRQAWGPRLRRSRLGRRIGEQRWDRAESAIARYGVPVLWAGAELLAGHVTALVV